jgi:diadenosine tetraphosphate (Ap4A) HIT family hydrolase
MSDCVLCAGNAGEVLWRDDLCRVVLAPEPDYPGFLRVILNAHVKEMTDLTEAERARLMRVVFAAEAVLREIMRPDKINLATLGNLVPHVHWHVIPRFADDPYFPQPVWGVRQREASRAAPLDLNARIASALNARL